MFNRKEKIRKDDLTPKELPHTRWQVFWDLIKYQKFTLLTQSTFSFLFSLPLVADIVFFYILMNISVNQGQSASYQFSLLFYMMVIAIPCMMIAFIGFGGSFEISKKLIFQEGILFKVDFFKGMKNNIKNALLYGFIMGISSFVLVVGVMYLAMLSSASPIVCGIGIGACIIQFIVLGCMGIYFLTQGCVYSNKTKDQFKNSFFLFGLSFLKIAPAFLLTVGLLVAMIMINIITQYIGLFLFALLSGVAIAIYSLICNATFDKYINKEHYPEYVNRGLYLEKTDNEEE